TFIEDRLRQPAELAADFASIDRVAVVMAGAVSNKGNETLVRSTLGAKFIENGVDLAHNLKIRALAVAPDIVGLADPTPLKHEDKSPRMILDVEPVANVRALAINRHRLAGGPFEDHERNELFRELIWAIVIRAIRNENG